MRCILMLSLAMTAGCATSSPVTSARPERTADANAPRQTMFLTIPGLRSTYADAPGASESMVRAAPALVRESIRKMIKELDIPLTVDDLKQDAFGNDDFQKSARIGKRPMSEFVDCGSTAIGPRAATQRMYISLITTVDSVTPRSTRVRSTMVASARDMSGTNNTRLHCGSTGALERLLIDSVTALAERN